MFPYGAVYVPGTGWLAVPGTAAVPAYSTFQDTASGIYFPAINKVRLTGKADAAFLEVDGTANANITAVPNGTGSFLVSGRLAVGSASTGTPVFFASNAGSVVTVTNLVDANLIVGTTVSGAGSKYAFLWPTTATGLAFGTAGAETERIAPSGNHLFGTAADGTGKIQLAAATASSGGIWWSSDLATYRVGAGQLMLDHIGGASPTFFLRENGSTVARIQTSSGSMIVETMTGQPLIFKTNSVTAGTYDANQNHIFKGVSVHSNGGVLVAALPAAASYQGAIGFVTDATLTAVTGLGLAVTGGGANKVPVYSDGANWIIL